MPEIPAKKLKRGQRKKKLAGRNCGRILAEFCQKWQKRGRIHFLKNFLLLQVMKNAQRQWQNFIYNFVDPSAERCFAFYVKIGRTFARIGWHFFMYWPENNFGTWQHWPRFCRQYTRDCRSQPLCLRLRREGGCLGFFVYSCSLSHGIYICMCTVYSVHSTQDSGIHMPTPTIRFSIFLRFYFRLL